MKRLLLAGGICAGLALLPGEAAAQTGTARGKVLDEKDQPVQDVVMTIEFQGGVTRKYETKTNKKGEYTQVGVFPGNYRVTGNKEGYQASYMDVRINLGEPTYLPDLKITSRSAAQAAAGDKMREQIGTTFSKAVELTQAGKLDEAEAAYKEVLAKNPSVPEVYLNLGYIYGKKKDWPAAEAAYLKAIELRPSMSDAHAALARTYQDMGQPDKAMEVMTKAAAENQGDAKVQFNLGVFHLNSGKTAEAEAAFRKAAELDTTNPEPHYYLGTIAVGQNNVADATAHLEKYLSMSPKNPQNVATAQALIQALKTKK